MVEDCIKVRNPIIDSFVGRDSFPFIGQYIINIVKFYFPGAAAVNWDGVRTYTGPDGCFFISQLLREFVYIKDNVYFSKPRWKY